MQSLINIYRSKPSLFSVLGFFMMLMYIAVLMIPTNDFNELILFSLLIGFIMIYILMFEFFTFIYVYPGRIEGRRLIFIMKKNSFNINEVKEIRRLYYKPKMSSRGVKALIHNSMRNSIWSGIEFVLEKPQKHKKYIQMNIVNLREIVLHVYKINPKIKVSKEVYDKLLKQ